MIKTRIRTKIYADKIKRRLDAKQRKVLFRLGGFLRSKMQRLMRYSKKSSRAGEPPRAHKDGPRGPLLRKLIRFAVDMREGSVVCGPELFGASRVEATKPLPQLLDQGGRIHQELKSGKIESADIAPRPFTPPTFDAGTDKFVELLERIPL